MKSILVNNLVFVFITMTFFLYIGRKAGWTLSKVLLYPAPFAVSVVLDIFWGTVVAIVVLSLIKWLNPGTVTKVIFGYGAGLYVSIPNFGLFNESTIPDEVLLKHTLAKLLPMISYIGFLAAFHYKVLR